ncbi:MAG: glycerol-3-phosphate dehydrogenase/oxidase, partial [Methylococcales bacterium]
MIRDFCKLSGQTFDVLVCGGGIYGAWTAYDAALRGLKVALVDQGDWAQATSSASSKLVHGGLRYLETLDVKLVKKALKERQMLMQAAPHRVWPLRFGIPVFADSRLGNVQLKIGLALYDFLAGISHTKTAHQYLSKARFAQRFPAVDTTQLSNGFTYLDAQTDDARLVLEIVAGALAAGAACVNYCQVADIKQQDRHRYTATVQDKINSQTALIVAKQVVNTIGQWTGAVHEHQLSKGVHLILPKILNDEALLLTAKADGRVFFIIPWYGRTLLGTTDTYYSGAIDALSVSQEDIDYLLSAANWVLKTVAWTPADIIGQFVGLRVLKANHKNSPSGASRDWQLVGSENGVLHSIGGKLTSAREDAAQIVDRLCADLAIKQPSQTDGRAFPWRPAADYAIWHPLAMAQAVTLGVDRESAHWLLSRHGNRI